MAQRHNLPNNTGVICFTSITSAVGTNRLAMAGLTELDELQEILKAETGTAGGDADEGIRRSQAGPGERQRADVVVILVGNEEDTPLAPVMADVKDLKVLTAPGVKGMRYFEELWSIRLAWCS
jgi:hypothetical protein